MKRVLVVLPNWYGEVLFATPFLKALHQQLPADACLSTLGWPQCREVLLHNPHVDECLDYDEWGLHRGLGGKWSVVRQLRAKQFDTAFMLRRSRSRSFLLRVAGIPRRVGFDHPTSAWLLTHRVPAAKGTVHKALTYLPLLEAVGLAARPGPYEYSLSDEERQAAAAWLRSKVALDARPLIVLHAGANWPHKRWAPERFAQLADRFMEARQVHVLVTGGPQDIALAQSIAKQMHHPAVVLAGQTTLRQLAACLAHAHLVVSNDTGVLHIAAALQRPVVALYGPTLPRLTGPLGDPARIVVLHHPDCCPHIPCYSPDHPAHPGMNAITVDEAYAAACKLLQFGMRNAECGEGQKP